MVVNLFSISRSVQLALPLAFYCGGGNPTKKNKQETVQGV